MDDEALTVTWFKDGQPLMQANRFRTTCDFGYVALDIAYTQVHDTGTYTCVAKNALGEAKLDAKLNVIERASIEQDAMHPASWQKIQQLEQKPGEVLSEAPRKAEPPVFIKELNSCLDLIEGQPGHFEAMVKPVNDPKLTISWFLNGQPITAGSRRTMRHDFGLCTMDLSYVLPDDVGTVLCVAQNEHGRAETQGELACKGRGSILRDTMHAQSWAKIQKLEEPKEGAEPVASAIQQKPSFTQPLVSLPNMAEGQQAVMDARVIPVNDPHLRLEWYHNGEPLLPANRISMTHDFGRVQLRISGLHARDTGLYMCRAVNQLGEAVTTAEITVAVGGTILGQPQHPEALRKVAELEAVDKLGKAPIPEKDYARPTFVKQLVDIEDVDDGAAVQLECQYEPKDDPRLVIDWLVNGQPLVSANRHALLNEFGHCALNITGVLAKDSALYTCRARNAHGEATTSCTLKVKGYQKILLDSAHPVSWQKIQQLEFRETEVQAAEPEAEAIKPYFTSGVQNVETTVEGQPIFLEATFEPSKDQRLRVQWFKNNEPIMASQLFKTRHELGKSSLGIEKAYANHSGLYTITIMNDHGEASTSCTVKIAGQGDIVGQALHADTLRKIAEMQQGKLPQERAEEPPSQQPPVIVRSLTDISIVEYGTIMLECDVTPKNDLTMNYEWQRNGKPVEIGNRINAKHEFGKCQLAIQKVTADDSGIYTLTATNAYGTATSSATVKCEGTGAIVSDTTHEQSVARIAQLEAGKEAAPSVAEAPPTPPQIVQPLAESQGSLKEGQSLHLAATAEPLTDPTLKAEWLHDGKPIEASTRFKLLNDFGWHILDIATLREADNGEWTLRVWNASGEAHTSTKVHVSGTLVIDLHTDRPDTVDKIHGLEAPKAAPQELGAPPSGPPEFIKQLTGQTDCQEGDTVHMEGQVSPATDPTLKVEWLKDGKPMQTGSRFKTISDFGFVVLEIHGALDEDQGTYTCVATTSAGRAESQFVLKCSRAPVLLTKPTVGAGKQRAISSLEEQLHRAKPEPADKPVSQAAPVFVEPLRNGNNLRDGDTANFYCRYTPLDNHVRIEWYVNGNPVVTGSRVRTVNEFGVAMLEISPVYEQDSGEYVCRAVNAFGEASTSVAMHCAPALGIIAESQLPARMHGAADKITLIEAQKPRAPEPADKTYGPPHFVRELQDLHDLVHGQLAHLECQVQPVGDPYLEIEWFHNGQPINHSNRIRMINDFGFVILELAPCNPVDSGEWICRARNRQGEAETRCSVGEVKPQSGVSYEWLRPIDKRDKINELESWLTRPKEGGLVSETDFDAPKIVHPISDLVDLVEGAQAAFQCQIEPQGDSSLHISWLHNGKPIPYSSRIQMHHSFGFAVLDISYTIPEDSGEYVCKVENSKGVAESKAQLSCLSAQEAEAPVIVQPLIPNIDQVREGDTVHMECRVGPINDPKLTVTWYLNDTPIELGSRHKTLFDFGFAALDISNLTASEDQGVYSCRATNARGQATTECKVTVAAGSSLVFERQVPARTGDHLQRFLAQYTNKEIMLTVEDFYKDGDTVEPVFRQEIQNIAVDEGSFARFEGQLAPINDPYMKVEWFHNGEPIMLGQRFRSVLERGWVALDLHYALPADTGEFTCVATNKHGQAKCSAMLACTPKKHVITGGQVPQNMRIADLQTNEESLYWSQTVEMGEQKKVRRPPTFTIPPRNAQVGERSPARFECAVTGFPKPKVTWFHNGGMVVQSARYKTSFDGMYFMTVNACRPLDAGEIVVVAKNLVGEAQMRASLDVLQTTEFANFRLRPARPLTENEISNRELQWQREALGDLGDHFSKQSKPPVHILYKLERDRPQPDSKLETEELQQKFEHKREDEFYERLQQVEKDRPSVEPIPFDWSGAKLRPASMQPGADTDRSGLPPVQLKRVKPKEPEPEPELDPGWLKTIEKKLSKEERARRYKQREAPPSDASGAPRDKVSLKSARPSPVSGPKEVPSSTIDSTRRKARIPEKKAELADTEKVEERPRSKERLKKGAFHLKEPTAAEPTKLEKPQMKPTPEYQLKMEQSGESESTKVEEQQRVVEQGGRRVTMQERKTLHKVHKEAEEIVTGQAPPTQLQQASARPPVQSQHVEPANVLQQLTPQHVELGRNAKFLCTFEGGQPLTVQWYKDGKQISSSVDHQIHTTDTATSLSIPKVKEWHGGEYSCRVQNAGGATQTNTNLQVLPRREVGDAPYFLRVLEDTHVQSGRPVQLDAAIESKPAASVHWFKDGQPVGADVRFKLLQDAQLHSLLIIEAAPIDTAVYECVASNDKGEARCKCKLTVEASQSRPTSPPKTPTLGRKQQQQQPSQQPPRITQQLTPQLTQQGKAATFTCNYAAPTASTSQEVSGGEQGGRTITKITKSMTKTSGSGQQDAAPSDGSPGFKIPLVSETFQPGDKVTLKAEIVGDPLPAVEWQHNKETILATDRDRKMALHGRQAHLTIVYAKATHAGEYRLLLNNAKGTAACSAFLTLQD